MTRTTSAGPRAATAHIRPTKPTSQYVSITPKIAADWLATSEEYAEKNDVRVNRRPSDGVIDRYARDMINNNWDDTGVPIIIDIHGVVRDGQQRLAAIVKSGITLSFNVVTGIQPEAQRSIDKGRRRTSSDDLYIASITDPLNVSAAASLLVALYSGNVAVKSYSPTPNEIHRFALTHTDDLLSAVRAARRVRANLPAITLSPFAALYYNGARIDETGIDLFFEALATGENLTTGDPILVLRNTVTRYATMARKPHRNYQLFQATIAWNAWRDGRTIQLLRVPNPMTRANFPVMK